MRKAGARRISPLQLVLSGKGVLRSYEVKMDAVEKCGKDPSINNIRKMFPAGMSRNLLALFVEIGNLSTLFTLVNISEIIVVYSIVLSR